MYLFKLVILIIIYPSNPHYRYITTFYLRRGIDFGSFKRDVLLFKSIALIQLFVIYFFPHIFTEYNQLNKGVEFELDLVSIGIAVIGYGKCICVYECMSVYIVCGVCVV